MNKPPARPRPSPTTLRRVLQLAGSVKKWLFVGLIALTIGSGINLLFPYLIRAILNETLGLSLQTDLNSVGLILIGLFFIQAIVFYLRHYCFSVAGHRFVADLRVKLFSAIAEQDISFFDSSKVGDLLSRLSADTQLLQRAVTMNISVALRYMLHVIGGIILMAVISMKLTAVILVLAPLIICASSIWGSTLRGLSRRMQTELGETNVIAEESISSIHTVKVYAGVPYEVGRYKTGILKTLQTGIERSHVASLFSSSMVFLVHTGIAVVIWYGGSLVLHSELTVGDLTAFVLYCVIVAVSVGFLTNVWDEFMQAVGASERIFEVLDSTANIVSPKSPAVISSKDLTQAHVAFNHVSFSYPTRPEKLVLDGLSFDIPPGQVTALVGPSGAGKSTIASLIARFYDPTSGSITFCGSPLPTLSLEQLRAQISFVSQSPQIFSGTIYQNIAYGRLNARMQEIQAAAEAASIHSFIEALPDKYDTLVGDKGIQLSGGQRQRIAIARAILKNPQFLILDEATSALDSENEFLVQTALQLLMKARTTLVIAHRLSTVQHADQVLVLRDGKIVQQGNHDSLLKDPQGLYHTLIQHQLL